MTDETIELKLCPFCGGEPVLGEDDLAGWIDCPTCGASIVDDHDNPTTVAAAWNRRQPTDAALGEADDYPGTPLARLDEAVLGRELIAWAAEPANVYACEAYTVKFCVFCESLTDHPDTCLHLRARALRDSDG